VSISFVTFVSFYGSWPFVLSIVVGKVEICHFRIKPRFRDTSAGGARSAFSFLHLGVVTRHVLPSDGGFESYELVLFSLLG